jgi:manganese/zinc/iron transport system permease protein
MLLEYGTSAALFAGTNLPVVVRIGLIAVLTVVACASIGSLLVLRRMSLMGDAISHAVLPGLVLAFFFTGTLNGNVSIFGWFNLNVMLIGAFLVGLITTWLIQGLENLGGIAADSSMGVVFTSMFAMGVVLIKLLAADKVDLDVDCVLNGSLSMISLNTIDVFGYSLPDVSIMLAAVCAINITVLVVLWKELRLCAFDPHFAATNGFRPVLLHYLIMALTAMTAVAAFQAVGSILVIAMLIVPAATAQLLTDRMSRYVILSIVIGVIIAVSGVALGHYSPVLHEAEPAALIAVCAGCLFTLTVIGAPQYGLLFKFLHRSRQSLRIIGEDLLAMFYRLDELAPGRKLGTNEALQSVGGGWLARLALWRQMHKGFLEYRANGWELSPKGEQMAANLVRSHRLWEAWLVQYLGLPLDHVHDPAERMEHYIDPALQAELRREIGDRVEDPHGRKIPKDRH